MNHNPSDNSANVHPSGQAVVDRQPYHLNPELAQALGCLDIKLEDELARFRSRSTQTDDPEPELQPLKVEPANWEDSRDMDSDAEIFTAEVIQIETADPIVTVEDDLPQPSGFIIIDGLTTSSTNSRDLSTTVNYAPMTVYRESPPQRQESLDVNFSTGGQIAPFHDEYLSSSQELLRQIQSGYPTSTETFNRTQIKATPKPNHFTPLKIGSITAACVLAGGVAYTAINPQILTTLTATKVVVSTPTNLIQTPNLAANEFTELNLSTLNNIKLPTAPVATVSSGSTAVTMNTTGTAPVPVAFNPTNAPMNPPATITSQPRLADSLIKSLLPANFQTYPKPSGFQPIPAGGKR